MSGVFEGESELAGCRTRLLELDGDGPAVLLLHGYSDSADTWRGTLDRLRRLQIPSIAVDMPGFGKADRLDRDEEILPQLDRFVAAAVAHARESHGPGVLVAGNSLGGCMAIRAAQDPALPIGAIVPVAPAGLDYARWIRVIQTAPALRAVLRTPIPVPTRVVRAAVGQAYRTMAFARPRAIDPRTVAAFTSHVTTKRDVIRTLATGARLYPEILDPFELGLVECPVMVIWGERDAMLHSSGADRLVEGLPHTRVELIADCGHCPQIEAPDRFVELLASFRSQISAGSAGELSRM